MADERSRQVRPPNLMRPGRGHGFGAERPKDIRTTLRRLLSYLRPYRHGIVIVFGLAAFGTAIGLLGPYLMGRAIVDAAPAVRNRPAELGLAPVVRVAQCVVALIAGKRA